MAVTGSFNTADAAQIDRLLNSQSLHGSESLCKLLRYLWERHTRMPGVPAKEHQIATEVFGRPADFDPKLDSMVRVQTGRLRAKIADYYSREGANDLLILDIPKGAYVITFVPREAAKRSFNDIGLEAAVANESDRHLRESRRWKTATLLLALSLAAAIVALVYSVMDRPKPEVALDPEPPSPLLQAYWGPLVNNADPIFVVFSNAAFVGRPETGLRYYNPATDGKDKITDHYTGVGEVIAIHELDRIFALLHHELRVKRGMLLALDDVKNNNLIFVGSPSENLTLREFPNTRAFAFRTERAGPRKGDLAIFNLAPRPGEESSYLAAPYPPLTDDYALMGLLPGINPGHWVMILAGTTTIGTDAAVEYVCHANTLSTLLSSIRSAGGSMGKPFEAVLHVSVRGGVPMESGLIAMRVNQ